MQYIYTALNQVGHVIIILIILYKPRVNFIQMNKEAIAQIIHKMHSSSTPFKYPFDGRSTTVLHSFKKKRNFCATFVFDLHGRNKQTLERISIPQLSINSFFVGTV